jgi:hypothetical protein
VNLNFSGPVVDPHPILRLSLLWRGLDL